MKKVLKTLVNLFAVAFLAITALSFTACKDIKTVEVKLSVYNYETSAFEDQTLTVDLYRHLAPKTVDNVLSAIKDGYYENALIYKFSNLSSQLMVGDLKADGENIVKQADRDMVEGEFSHNGLNGSNLVNKKGYIGLWRTYTAVGGSYTKSDKGMNSGTAVWYMPTTSLSSYNGYFAVFAKFDTENANNAAAFSAITAIFSGSYYESYDIFYTVGENDAKTLRIIKSADLEEDDLYDEENKTYDGEEIYEAKGSDFVSLNKRTVYIPNVVSGKRAITVTSIKIK